MSSVWNLRYTSTRWDSDTTTTYSSLEAADEAMADQIREEYSELRIGGDDSLVDTDDVEVMRRILASDYSEVWTLTESPVL